MLKGKNVIVTGAAKGIGKAIALAFAKEGCNVVLNYHSHLDEETVKEIEDYGVICKPVQGDVSDFAFAADMIKEVKKELGSIYYANKDCHREVCRNSDADRVSDALL